jgi:hypothetical protein
MENNILKNVNQLGIKMVGVRRREIGGFDGRL